MEFEEKAKEDWKKYLEYLKRWIEENKNGNGICPMSPDSFERWLVIEESENGI